MIHKFKKVLVTGGAGCIGMSVWDELIKRGVQVAKNDWVLTTDADCSVSNFQLTEWIRKKYLNQNNLIYFGSRNHRLSIVKKKLQDKLLEWYSNF